MQFKLGKLPPVHDARTLTFGAYLTAALPNAPAAVGYGDKVPTWPMYDNDRYGDCTAAAAGHMIQSWTANVAHEVTPTEPSVLKFYEHFVGTPPPPDTGCSMLDVLNYWRKSGLGHHKISAFAALDLANHSQARAAVWLFGAVYIGVALPTFATEGDMLAVPWVVPHGGAVGKAAPNPKLGHCIPAVGYDEQHLYVVTWGELKSMSWGFYDAYAEEAYAVLSRDFLDAVGKAPAGFDLATLQTDLSKVANVPADAFHA
jgi:hypothetical protein